MGGSAAAAEEVAIAGGSGAGRGVRNPAAKFASLTGALRRHSRNAGLGGGGSGGGEDDTPSATTPTAFCKEPATPHMWLCSRQPRTPLGFLPRLGRSSSGESSGGGPGGISSRGKGGKESLDPPNLRRHFTTVSGSDVLGLEGAKGRSGGGKAGRQGGAVGGGRSKAHKESGGASMGALDIFSSGRADGGGSTTKAGDARAGRGGKKMPFFSGFGGASSKGSGGDRSRQRTSLARDTHGGGMAGGEDTDEESVRTVPLQLEDEGLLQVSMLNGRGHYVKGGLGGPDSTLFLFSLKQYYGRLFKIRMRSGLVYQQEAMRRGALGVVIGSEVVHLSFEVAVSVRFRQT